MNLIVRWLMLVAIIMTPGLAGSAEPVTLKALFVARGEPHRRQSSSPSSASRKPTDHQGGPGRGSL